jgi:hypothetical protein
VSIGSIKNAKSKTKWVNPTWESTLLVQRRAVNHLKEKLCDHRRGLVEQHGVRCYRFLALMVRFAPPSKSSGREFSLSGSAFGRFVSGFCLVSLIGF